MNPKEKAKELVSKFRGYCLKDSRTDSDFWSAKLCALIVVDECIGVEKQVNDMLDGEYSQETKHPTFYEQVKEELEKL